MWCGEAPRAASGPTAGSSRPSIEGRRIAWLCRSLQAMTPSSLECLACGKRRSAVDSVHSHLATGECPRCGYVGWAPATDLTEFTRRALRDRPVERRRLRLRRAS